MKFSTTEFNKEITVTLTGPIAYEDSAYLNNRLMDLVYNRKETIILDLKDVPSLNTGLLSLIIKTNTILAKQGRTLKLAHANDQTANLFAMMRLTDSYIFIDTMETA